MLFVRCTYSKVISFSSCWPQQIPIFVTRIIHIHIYIHSFIYLSTGIGIMFACVIIAMDFMRLLFMHTHIRRVHVISVGRSFVSFCFVSLNSPLLSKWLLLLLSLLLLFFLMRNQIASHRIVTNKQKNKRKSTELEVFTGAKSTMRPKQ